MMQKEFYLINEAAKEVQVEAHVLRYWEDGNHMLGPLGDHGIQALLSLILVAQEIRLGNTGDGLIQALSQLQKCIAIRLLRGFKFLETLVAGNDEKVILAFQQVSQLAPGLQLILGIVFQLLTFLTNSKTNQNRRILVHLVIPPFSIA